MAKPKDNSDVSGIAFAGCVVLGIGLGVLVNQAGAGTLLGIGVGFIVMALIRSKGK
jgi:hypothetical protein